MNYPKFLLISKGFLHLFYRSFLVLTRFGLTSKKIARDLYAMSAIANKYGAKISLNITAVVLNRHPALIKDLYENGVEFGAHGYVHTNYSTVSLSGQIESLNNTKDVFARHQLPLYGFRAPYLSYSTETLKAIDESRLFWSSNQVIDWEVLDQNNYPEKQWKTYQKLLNEIYKPKSSSRYLSIPAFNSNYVEIPISIPDDEILIDRLKLHNSDEIGNIWTSILRQTQKRGELFTLQLHHERFKYYKKALESILQVATDLKSKIWLASLNEIAEWWNEKRWFNFDIIHQEGNEYRVLCDCSPRAAVLIKNVVSRASQKTFFNGYKVVHSLDFIVESHVKPCIGLSPSAPAEMVHFLKREGFAFEINQNKDCYGLYLENHHTFSKENEREFLSLIEDSSSPLIRFWRWPDEKISALSITGDIDSITLWDFLARFFEF